MVALGRQHNEVVVRQADHVAAWPLSSIERWAFADCECHLLRTCGSGRSARQGQAVDRTDPPTFAGPRVDRRSAAIRFLQAGAGSVGGWRPGQCRRTGVSGEGFRVSLRHNYRIDRSVGLEKPCAGMGFRTRQHIRRTPESCGSGRLSRPEYLGCTRRISGEPRKARKRGKRTHRIIVYAGLRGVSRPISRLRTALGVGQPTVATRAGSRLFVAPEMLTISFLGKGLSNSSGPKRR